MADKKSKFSIVIGAVDDISMKVMEINQKIAKALEPVKKLNSAFGLLGSELGVGKFGSALSAVKDKFGDVFKEAGKIGLALGAAGAGFAFFVKGTADYADGIKDASDRLGVGTTKFQEWRYTAQQAGLDANDLEGVLTKFNRTLGDAVYDGGKAGDIFGALGVQIKDATGNARSMEDILPEVADSLNKIQNPTLRNAVLFELFGKQGTKMAMFLGEGSEGLKRFAKEAHEIGAIIPPDSINQAAKFNDQLDSLLIQFNALKVSALGDLFPVLLDLLKQVQTYLKDNAGAIKEWVSGFAKDLPGVLSGIVSLFKGLWAILTPIISLFNKLSEAFGSFNVVAGFLAVLIATKLTIAILGLISTLTTLGIVTMTTPIGWIAAGIFALIAAIVLLVFYWEDVIAVIKKVWNMFLDSPFPFLLGGVYAFIKVAALLIEAWQKPGNFFVNLWDGIVAQFENGVNSIMWLINKLLSFLPESIQTSLGFNTESSLATSATGPSLNAAGVAQAAQASPFKNQQPNESILRMTFDNMPPGARVTTEKTDNPMEMIMQGVPMGNF